MKKLQAVAVLPLFALASCGQTPANTQEVTPEVTSETQTPVVEVETSTAALIEETQTLSGEISETQTSVVPEENAQTIEMSASYKLPNGMEVPFTATLEVKDGIVVAVSGLEGKQGPQKTFAEAFPNLVIGKPLQGLQVDAVSGASLTTAAVNSYLSTLN